MLILGFTALISLILGMGLPTTANYIVVSTLMAPVIVDLGAQNGLIVPLIAVHLFVFYFGILADDTPPVGLAAFAAAGISGGDPIKTGIQGFTYDIRTAILPFMFIFNTQLLMIGVDSIFVLILVVATAIAAMMAFAAATQGFFLVKSRVWETVALLLVTFLLFRPGYIWDKFFPPLTNESPSQIETLLAEVKTGSMLRVMIKGERMNGEAFTKTVMLPVGDQDSGKARLESIGLELRNDEGTIIIDNVVFASAAEKAGLDFDQEIINIQMPTDRLPKQLVFIPACALFALVYLLQRRRRDKLEMSPA